MKLLYSIIIINLIFSQKFDPTTGKLINEALDSIKTNIFNPETGQYENTIQNSKFNAKTKILSRSEIIIMAKRDVFQYFNDEMITYKYLGGAVSLSTILPSALVGMGLGYALTDEDDFGFMGFWSGGILSAYGTPKLIAKLDTSKPILLDIPHVQELTAEQKQIYLNQVSKELQQKRIKEIYKGQRYILGLTIGIPIILGMFFG
tara:strand:- start:337 stop:948 length:612 start_codon:yes stop_codon:yes gene_type:complete